MGIAERLRSDSRKMEFVATTGLNLISGIKEAFRRNIAHEGIALVVYVVITVALLDFIGIFFSQIIYYYFFDELRL